MDTVFFFEEISHVFEATFSQFYQFFTIILKTKINVRFLFLSGFFLPTPPPRKHILKSIPYVYIVLKIVPLNYGETNYKSCN